MAQYLRLAKVEEPTPEPQDFLLTETAKHCLRGLHRIHVTAEARFTMIAGPQGIGKSKALQHFAATENETFPFTVFRGEGNTMGISEMLIRFFTDENPNGKSLTARRTVLCEHRGDPMTLIFDEAQNFEEDALEWITNVAATCCWSVAFVGGPDLPQLVAKCQSLSGRIIAPVILASPPREDAMAVARNLGVFDPAALGLLATASHRKGKLRNVVESIEVARTLAGDGEITAEHISKVVGKLVEEGGR